MARQGDGGILIDDRARLGCHDRNRRLPAGIRADVKRCAQRTQLGKRAAGRHDDQLGKSDDRGEAFARRRRRIDDRQPIALAAQRFEIVLQPLWVVWAKAGE